MKKLKILLAALLVIGSTAKAQVVYGENETVFFCSDWQGAQPEMNDPEDVALSLWKDTEGSGSIMLHGLPFLPPFLASY